MPIDDVKYPLPNTPIDPYYDVKSYCFTYGIKISDKEDE